MWLKNSSKREETKSILVVVVRLLENHIETQHPDFLQAKLKSEVTASFLLNERGDLWRFCIA